MVCLESTIGVEIKSLQNNFGPFPLTCFFLQRVDHEPHISKSIQQAVSMSQPGGTGKAIPSLAKKPDQSKGSGQKLKFVPTLPPRRVKSCVGIRNTKNIAYHRLMSSLGTRSRCAPSTSSHPTNRVDHDSIQEPVAGSSSSQTAPSRGGTGRGRGRGGAPRSALEMKASGPFAMGPSLVGSSRRPVPRSNFTPIMPPGMSKGGTLGSGLTQTTAPTLGVKKEPKSEGDVKAESDEEVYSEPDEGVEIVDMNDIRKMDWMAPETLKREPEHKRKAKPKKKGNGKTALVGQAGLDYADGLLGDFVLWRVSDSNLRRYGR